MIHTQKQQDDRRQGERGAALVLAIFVLVILAGTGLVLTSLSRNELMMSRASLQNERAFFVAEAGLESGRAALLLPDGSTDPNSSLAAAAGLNGQIDFDPHQISAAHDASGNVIGFEGYGDDVPLLGPTRLGGALFAAFLANDPEENAGATPLIDDNGHLVVFGVGTGANGALEIVKGMVRPASLLPSLPPCTIMMLGPTPDFDPGVGDCSSPPTDDEDEDEDEDEEADGGFVSLGLDDDEDEDEDEDIGVTSSNKTFWGTDCPGGGGQPGHYVPVICVQGCGAADGPYDDEDEDEDEDAEAGGFFGFGSDEDEDEDEDVPAPICADTVVEAAIEGDCPNNFISGPHTGADTVADINDPENEPTMGAGYEIDPGWTDCGSLQTMLVDAREMAHFSCSGNGCSMTGAGWDGGVPPTTGASSITFVDGDLEVGPGHAGSGLLFVTGTLELHASASWNGPMVIVGEGRFIRTGSVGNGLLSGAAVVINIAGEDGTYGTDDDCADGFGVATYHEAEQETGDTQYCTDDLTPADPLVTYDLTQFRQY